MKAVVVFCGPTISAQQVRAQVDAEVQGPAARGDVARAARRGPAAIALIDGYFHSRPAVWHKEILWAMSRGVHVFGSSSMGALRAAELEAFGMEGVGRIFEAYRAGALEDDDEVAIVHSAEERGFRRLSEALIDIRSTLTSAVGAKVLSREGADLLVRVAKSLPYYERSYPRLLEMASPHLGPEALETLRAWLPTGAIDQKLRDARELLGVLRVRSERGWDAKQVDFRFAHTDAWAKLEGLLDAEESDEQTTVRHARLVDELLVSGWLRETRVEALARALGNNPSGDVEVTRRTVAKVAEDFRRERGLTSEESFARWCRDQDLKGPEIDAFFEREARLRRLELLHDHGVNEHLVDALRASGRYVEIVERARVKATYLAERALEEPTIGYLGLSEDELWSWFFGECLAQAPSVAIDAYAALQGVDRGTLRTAVLRHRCFVQLRDET